MIGQPIFPPQIIPQNSGGFDSDRPYKDVVLSAYRNQADMESNLFIRFYNYALKKWITDLIVIDGRPIICVKSTPMRAFSTYRHLLIHNGFKDLPKDAEDIERFPLPFANFTRGVPKINKEYKQDSFPIRNIGFLDNTMKRRTSYSRYPRPYRITYSVDMWCQYESHMDYIIQRMNEQFTPIAYTVVDNPFSKNGLAMPIKLIDITDNSDLEREDTEDRLLRTTFSLEVEAWMFYDIKSAPTYMTNTHQVILVDDKNLSNPEVIVSESTKLSELAPLTVDELKATTIPVVPDNQA